MGYWGNGVTQSDEFAEVYENFMEEYDKGKDVAEISKSIINEYLAEFDEDEPVLYNMYFALAKAQWMCCELSEDLLLKVEKIINSSNDIEFIKELGADDSDIILRKKSLRSFLHTLQTPRKVPRKRHNPPKSKNKRKKEKFYPEMHIGDVFSYKFYEGFRLSVLLDKVEIIWKNNETNENKYLYFCVVLKNTYNVLPPVAELLKAKVCSLGLIPAGEFLTEKEIKVLYNISVPENKYREIFKNTLFLVNKSAFYSNAEFPIFSSLKEVLDSKDINLSFLNDFGNE